MIESKQYVLGFIFDETGDNVLLMRKKRPKWQAGKLNGIGGKIEPNESALCAIVRESEEELELKDDRKIAWYYLGVTRGKDWIVFVYTAQHCRQITAAEDEPVAWYEVSKLPRDVIPNLRFLVPLCQYRLTSQIIVNLDEM